MSIERLLLVGIQGGVLGIFVLPLFVIPEAAIFPVRIFNNFLFRMLVEIIGALYAILVLYNRAYLPRFSFLSLAIFLFIGSLGISTLFGLHPWRSFWGDILRMQGYIFFLHLLLFYTVLIGTFRNYENWIPLIRFLLLVSGVLAIAVLMANFSLPDAQRITPLPENPSFYGSYLALIIFLNIFWLFQEKQRTWKLFFLLTLFLNLMALVLNETRGAWVAVFGGFMALLLIWFFSLAKNQPRKRVMLGVTVIFLVFLFFSTLLLAQTYIPDNSSLARYYSLWNSPFEQTRFFIWGMILPAIGELPFFGYGPESFQHIYEKYYQHAFSLRYPTEPISFYHAHNQMLDILVVGGFFGLFCYLSLFGIAFFHLLYYSLGTINPFARMCLLIILVVHLVESMFLFETLYASILFFAILAFISVVSFPSTQHLSIVPHWSHLKTFIVLGMLVGLVTSLSVFHWQPIKSHFYLQQARVSFQRSETEKGIRALEDAVSTQSFMNFDIAQFGLSFLILAQQKIQDSVVEKHDVHEVETFAQLVETQLQANPTYPSIYPRKFLAEAYMNLYRLEGNPVYLTKAREVEKQVLQLNAEYASFFSFVKENKKR